MATTPASNACPPTYDPDSNLPYNPDGYASYQEQQVLSLARTAGISGTAATDAFYKNESLASATQTINVPR